MKLYRLISRATTQPLEGRQVELNFLASDFQEALRVAQEELAKGEQVEALFECCPVVEGVGEWLVVRRDVMERPDSSSVSS